MLSWLTVFSQNLKMKYKNLHNALESSGWGQKHVQDLNKNHNNTKKMILWENNAHKTPIEKCKICLSTQNFVSFSASNCVRSTMYLVFIQAYMYTFILIKLWEYIWENIRGKVNNRPAAVKHSFPNRLSGPKVKQSTKYI